VREKVNEAYREKKWDFCGKLNQRKYRELEYCRKKLTEQVKAFTEAGKFVKCQLLKGNNGAISLTWIWDEECLLEEEIFMLRRLESRPPRKKYRKTWGTCCLWRPQFSL